MANGNLGSYAVSLPNLFQAPGQSLQSATQQLERQTEVMAERGLREQEMAERKAEREEAARYRKTQNIQNLLDTSKYQTGSDAVNAIINTKALELQSKYFDMANKGVSDADIAQDAVKEFSSLVQGANRFKAEEDNFDENLKTLKTKFPNLNIPALKQKHREDNLQRSISKEGQFINPVEVKESSLATQLLDPDFISNYITDINDLEKQVLTPKAVKEMNVAVGGPKDFVPFEGKIPFFAEAVLPEGYREGDYLPRGTVPGKRIKYEVVPEIKKITGSEFRVVPDDVYENFADDVNGKVLVTALTRNKFPSYDDFTPVEKYNAKKNALYEYLNQKDVSGFTSKERKVKSDTNISIPKEEKGLEGLNWVKNFTNAVNNKQIDTAIGEARKLFAGAGGKYEFKDLKIAPDGGMSFEYYPTIDGVADKTEVLREKISPSDPNKNYKVANLYQKITGQDVKMERKVLGGKEDLSTPAQSGKITVILDGKLGEIPANNWEAFKKKYPNAKRQ